MYEVRSSIASIWLDLGVCKSVVVRAFKYVVEVVAAGVVEVSPGV
jgi:hypothetical protein